MNNNIEKNIPTITYRLYGDNVSPSTFRSKDVGEILISFEDILRSLVKDIEPDISDREAFISICEISDKSLSLKHEVKILAFVTAFTILGESITNNNFDRLPSNTIDNLKEIQRKVRTYNCSSQFILGGKVIGELTATTEIRISKNQSIQGDTTIYGRVIRVGGIDPRVRFQLIDGYYLTMRISEKLAKQLAKNIYSLISLHGSATWNKKDYQIIDFKIKDIGTYRETSVIDSFKDLRLSIGRYWDSIDNIEEKLNYG